MIIPEEKGTPEDESAIAERIAAAPGLSEVYRMSGERFSQITSMAFETVRGLESMGLAHHERNLFIASMIVVAQLIDGVSDEVMDYTLRGMRGDVAKCVKIVHKK